MDGTRTYGGLDGGRRRADRRARLVEAGLELLGTPGAELTVRGACRAAGLAGRYFYESFADRDALAAAVHDEVVRGIAGAASAAVDAPGLAARDRVRAGVAAIVGILAEDPRRGRVLFGPDLAARHEESARLFVTLFARRQHDPDDLVASFAVGGLARVLGSWLTGGLVLPREELVDRCTGLLLAVQRSRV